MDVSGRATVEQVKHGRVWRVNGFSVEPPNLANKNTHVHINMIQTSTVEFFNLLKNAEYRMFRMP